jgi:hypothetical protein
MRSLNHLPEHSTAEPLRPCRYGRHTAMAGQSIDGAQALRDRAAARRPAIDSVASRRSTEADPDIQRLHGWRLRRTIGERLAGIASATLSMTPPVAGW